MINISVNQKTKTALLDLGNMDQINKDVIKECWFDSGELIKRRTKSILDTGKRTGRTYTIKGRRHQASAPGEAPKTRTGALAKSVQYKVSGWPQLTVGASAGYAGFLEDGTNKMGGRTGARKYLIRAVNDTSGDTINIFYSRLQRKLKK